MAETPNSSLFSKMDKFISKIGNDSIVKHALESNNITTNALSSAQIKQFKIEFTKRLVIELLNNDKFRQPLVTFVTSGDYQGLAEKLFSLGTVHEIFKAVTKVTLNLVTDNKFGLLQKSEVPGVSLGAMDLLLRFYFHDPEDLIDWPNRDELTQQVRENSAEIQDALLKKGSGLFFKLTGLEAYERMLAITTTLSDTWMLAFGIANPPNDFIYTFSDYFPECGETSINLTSILPKQATVGRETTFVISGTLLSRVSMVSLENCANSQVLLRENERIAVECTPTAAGNQSLHYGIVGSSQVYTASAEAVFVDSVKEPIIDNITGEKTRPGIKHPFAIHGSNLENVIDISIDDCPNTTIVNKTTNLITAECNQFNSSGFKNMAIEHTTNTTNIVKNILAFQVVGDTEATITSYYPKSISTLLRMNCFSQYSITSRVNISGINLDNTYMICESTINNITEINSCFYQSISPTQLFYPTYMTPNGRVDISYDGSGIKRIYFFGLQERNVVNNGGQANISNSLDFMDIAFDNITATYDTHCF